MENRKFVIACETCQKRKAERMLPKGSMHSYNLSGPNQLIAVDCLGRVIETPRRNKHLIDAIDFFTKFVTAKAIPDLETNHFVDFLTYFCATLGSPKELLSNTLVIFALAYLKK